MACSRVCSVVVALRGGSQGLVFLGGTSEPHGQHRENRVVLQVPERSLSHLQLSLFLF
jgi:hypothetical protein